MGLACKAQNKRLEATQQRYGMEQHLEYLRLRECLRRKSMSS
jgi:hypothetical protein